MDDGVTELWRFVPTIIDKLDGVCSNPGEHSKQVLFAALGLASSNSVAINVEETKPGVEDFEYALQASILGRLESNDDRKIDEVVPLIDVAAFVVAELFERSAALGAAAAETERCKSWWTMFVTVAEDTCRLAPTRILEGFVGDFESSLVRLRAAYLKLALLRLAECDAKQEAEAKASEEGASGQGAAELKDGTKEAARQAKLAQDRESKRIEERKKQISHLGISPNGQLFLTLTSLLKQVTSRLPGSLHTPLRARVTLLLEKLLAMDYKAIANNQKNRATDYVQLEDLDPETDGAFPLVAPPRAAVVVVDVADGTEFKLPNDPKDEPKPKAEGEVKSQTEVKAEAGVKSDAVVVSIKVGQDDAMIIVDMDEGTESTPKVINSLGGDPAVDYKLYRSFWELQEYLLHPERLFDRPDGWETFHRTLSKQLELFQKYPVQDPMKQPWAPPEPAPLRQAPRSSAFGVQMDDPGFRQQFLTQVMIAFQALEQGVSGKQDASGIMSRQTDKIKGEFETLKKKVQEVLEHARVGYTELLSRILEREAHWVAWKGHGCREYQRDSLEMLNGKAPPADELPDKMLATRPAKPVLAPYIQGMLKTLKNPQWKVGTPATGSEEEVAKSMRPHVLKSMCDSYLERLMEDEKPENGIEEDYKAKKNKVFMWQCRRLFATQHLRLYARKDVGGATGKTDFLDIVRMVQEKEPEEPAANGHHAGAEGAAAEAEAEDQDLPNDVHMETAEEVGADTPAEPEPDAADNGVAVTSPEDGELIEVIDAGKADEPAGTDAEPPTLVIDEVVEATEPVAATVPVVACTDEVPPGEETAQGTKRDATDLVDGDASDQAAKKVKT